MTPQIWCLVTLVQQGARTCNHPMGSRTKGDPDMVNPEISSIKSFSYLASPPDTFSLELKGLNQETTLILNSYNKYGSFSTIGLFLCESPDQATLSVGVTRLSGKHPTSILCPPEEGQYQRKMKSEDRSRSSKWNFQQEEKIRMANKDGERMSLSWRLKSLDYSTHLK